MSPFHIFRDDTKGVNFLKKEERRSFRGKVIWRDIRVGKAMQEIQEDVIIQRRNKMKEKQEFYALSCAFFATHNVNVVLIQS